MNKNSGAQEKNPLSCEGRIEKNLSQITVCHHSTRLKPHDAKG